MHKASALFLVALLLGATLAACGQAAPTSELQPTAEPTAEPATEPDTAEEFFQAGNQHAQAGELEEAIAAYEAALELEPGYVSAMTNLGVAYYNIGQLDEAVAEYQKALQVAPDDEAIHSNLAAAYVQQGKLDEALAAYNRALELEPSLSQAYFGLGVIYMQMGQNEDAIAAFESTLSCVHPGQDSWTKLGRSASSPLPLSLFLEQVLAPRIAIARNITSQIRIDFICFLLWPREGFSLRISPIPILRKFSKKVN